MSIAAMGAAKFDAQLPVLAPDQPRAEVSKPPAEPRDLVAIHTTTASASSAVKPRSGWSKVLLGTMTGITVLAGLGATATPALAQHGGHMAAAAPRMSGNAGARGAGGFQNRGFQSGGFQSRGFQSGGFQNRGFQSGGFQNRGFQGNNFQHNNPSVFRGGFQGGRAPGGFPGGRAPGGFPGGRAPGGFPGGRAPGGFPGGRAPGGFPGGRAPGGFPGGRVPGGFPGGRVPGGFPGGRVPGGIPGGWRGPGGWHGGPIIAPHPEFRNRVIFNNYFGPHWGPGWGGPWGFYGGGAFWLGFTVGGLVNYDLWATQPIYVVSPYSGCEIGMLEQPQQGVPLSPERQMQMQVLNAMANPQQSPDSYDPTAGVYPAYGDNVDPSNPGPKISGAYAYNLLAEGRGIFFHSPNGAYEKIQNLNELDSYLYAPQDAAPAGAAVVGQQGQ